MSEKIHAVCSDIDGTQIIPGQKIPTAEVQQAARGLSVPLLEVSARSYDMLKPFLDPNEGVDLLGLGDNYCVLSGGASVVRANTGVVEWSKRIPRMVAQDVVRGIGGLCTNIHYDKATKRLSPAQFITGIEEGRYLTEDVPSLFAIFSKTQADAMREQLGEFKTIATPRFMQYDRDPEKLCLQLGSHKGEGTGEALSLADLAGKPVLKIGDGANDIDLFLSAPGPNVAIGNPDADPELLEMARMPGCWIAPPVHENGFAAAIERYRPYFA